MNPDFSKLRQQQKAKEELTQNQGAAQGHNAREFSSIEEALRFDSNQNPVPPEVAERLNESIKKEPKPGNWWNRLFGK
jgi:hypothetical protein